MMAQSKITSRGRVTIPREVRDALKLASGDILAFEIHSHSASMTKAIDQGDPFATFMEWSGEADTKGYRTL